MNLILATLLQFWNHLGIDISYDSYNKIPIGAATYNYLTLDSINKKKNIAFACLCFRPFDNYSNNKFRQTYFIQVQIIVNLSHHFFQKLNTTPIQLAHKSINKIVGKHHFNVLHDNWNAPTMKSYGTGWEYRVNKIEVLQITKFKTFMDKDVSSEYIYEFAYGIERLSFCNDSTHDPTLDINYDDFQYQSIKQELDKYQSKSDKDLHDILMQICNSENIIYDNFLYANLIFNILDQRSFFNIYSKNIYMKFISKIINKINK
jgi:glycyl-tRNA synthetase alpha subunit